MATRYWAEIVAAAAKHGLDPVLVEAVVTQESSGDTDGFRFERDFFNRYIRPKNLFPGMNPRRVSSSYGLMQVMYPVAVERGFDSKWAPELLFVPETGLDFGCRQLKMLVDWAEGFDATPENRLKAVLASYNGGRGSNKPTDSPLRNAGYANSVLKHYVALKVERA